MTDLVEVSELVEWLRHFAALHKFNDGTLTFGGERLFKAAAEIERLRSALEIIAKNDDGFLGQTATAALTKDQGDKP